MGETLRVLVLGPVPRSLTSGEWGRWELVACDDLDTATVALADGAFDAALLRATSARPLSALRQWPGLSQLLQQAAVVVEAPDLGPEAAREWLALGAQDLLPARASAELPRVLRLAVERRRIESAVRRAAAKDVATGLPDHAQLLEHMTHLLALREREPAPMALIVVRVEGLAAATSGLDAAAAQVLWRKVAVRLRSALRASDVVAALGADRFGVLLAWIDSPGAGQRVEHKLREALQRPFQVSGRQALLAVSTGLAIYPHQGREAGPMLHHASAQAALRPAEARGGTTLADRGAAQAANDERGPGDEA